MLAIVLFTFLFGVEATQSSSTNVVEKVERSLEQGEFETSLRLVRMAIQENPSSAYLNYLEGLAFSGMNNWGDAYKAFHKALELDRQLLEAKRNLGISAYHLQKMEEAEGALQAYVGTAPDDPVAYAYLGRIALAREQFDEAVKLIGRSEAVLKEDDWLKIDFARALFKIGKNREAEELLKAIRSEDSLLFFQVGMLLAEKGLHSQAAENFERARANYPDRVVASFNLALSHHRAGSYARAAAVLEELVKDGTRDPDVFSLLADSYIKSNRLREAYDMLQWAVFIAADKKRHYVDLLSLCIDLEEFDNGFPLVDLALKQYPDAHEFYMQRALLYCLRNQFDLAAVDCRRAIQLSPENEGLHVGLATILMNADQLHEANEILERLSRTSKNYFPLYLYALNLIRLGVEPFSLEENKALQALESSIKSNPKYNPARVALARLHRTRGQLDLAQQELERAIELEPNDRVSHYELYRLYLKLGRTVKAKEIANKLEQISDFEREEFGRWALVKQGLRHYAQSPGEK